jgi:hypothetical protein
MNNKLWIATATGVACLDISTKNLSRFGASDGFSLMPLRVQIYFMIIVASLYTGFTNHIIRFDPDSLLNGGVAPALFIESIRFAMIPHIIFQGND